MASLEPQPWFPDSKIGVFSVNPKTQQRHSFMEEMSRVLNNNQKRNQKIKKIKKVKLSNIVLLLLLLLSHFSHVSPT